IPCGHCEFCEQGHPNLCSNLIFAGHAQTDGSLREWMTWHEKSIFPIPDSLSFDDAAMLEPLGVAIHTVDLGKLRPGMTVGVFGCGPIGLLILQMAKLSGAATIIATDKLAHRVDAAKSLEASHAFLVDEDSRLSEPSLRSPRRGSTVEMIQAATQGRGVDVAFDAAGTPDAVDAAFAAVST